MASPSPEPPRRVGAVDVQPDQPLEDPLALGLRHPRARVDHVDAGPVLLPVDRHLHRTGRPGGADGVVEEIADDAGQLLRIGEGGTARARSA